MFWMWPVYVICVPRTEESGSWASATNQVVDKSFIESLKHARGINHRQRSCRAVDRVFIRIGADVDCGAC